jgi:heme-degrading monooxygenase HmoA
VTSVDLFAVPPGADAEFLADWAAEARAATLYRALRDDVDFRFAAIGEDVAGDLEGGCLQIEAFEVRDGEAQRFLAAWEASRAALAGRRGYLGARLIHGDEGAFRFIGITRWSSPLMSFRARDGATIPFASHAALYQPVAR